MTLFDAFKRFIIPTLITNVGIGLLVSLFYYFYYEEVWMWKPVFAGLGISIAYITNAIWIQPQIGRPMGRWVLSYDGLLLFVAFGVVCYSLKFSSITPFVMGLGDGFLGIILAQLFWRITR